jgi:hypothetical protein
MGLMASGRMNDSTLLRVPRMGPAFGPIVASSKRLASRYANTLRMGYAAASVEAFADCSLIWIQAPAAELADLQFTVLRSPVELAGKTFILLDADLDCSSLAPLAAAGAAVASLAHVPLLREEILLAEGDPGALRALRPVWRSSGARAIELKAGQKQVYTAGLMAAEALTAATAGSALACLRSAGFDQATAKRLTGTLVEIAVREQLTHGRKSWISPASETRRELTLRQIEALHASDPALACFMRSTLAAVLCWYGESREWLGPG